MAAPSANSRRLWHFVVVRDQETRARLAQTHRWSGMIAQAPLAIAVCGEKQRTHHWVEDASTATENLLLAVTALDLGAVWILIHPDTEREAHVRELLGIPQEIGVLCPVAVGRPAEHKPPQENYEETRIHLHRW